MNTWIDRNSRWAGTTLGLLLVVSLAAGCSGRKAEQYRQEGETYLNLGRHADAAASFEAAITADPGNASAWYGLAQAQRALEEDEDSIESLRTAVDLDPSLTAAAEELVPLLVGRGEVEAARRIAEAVAGVDAALGERLLARVDTARQAPQTQATGGQPSAAQPAEDWQTLWKNAELQEFLANRNTWLAGGGDTAVRAKLCAAALAYGDMTLAAELSAGLPEESPVRTCVAAIQGSDLEALRTALEAWEAEEGTDAQLLKINVAASGLARTGARAMALRMLSSAARAWPDQGISLYNAARIFQAANLPEYAAQSFERLFALAPENMEVRTQLFHIHRSIGNTDDARRTAEATYSMFPESKEAILNLALAYLDAREFATIDRIIELGLDEFPNDPALQASLAVQRLRTGRTEDARNILDSIADPGELAPRIDGLRAVVAALDGDWDTVAQRIAPRMPERVVAAERLLLAASRVQAGQSDAAREALYNDDEALAVPALPGALIANAIEPGSVEANDEVMKLAAAFRADPGLLARFSASMALVMSDVPEPALDLLAQVAEATGPNVVLNRVRLDAMATAPSPDVVAQARELAAASPSAGSWVGLASVLKAAGDEPGEREALENAVAASPEAVEPRFRLAQWFERHDQMAEAKQHYETLAQQRPDDPAVANNLAYCLLVTDGDAGRALEFATRAIETLKDNPSVLHTLGVAQLRNGMLDESDRNLRVALEIRPGDPTLLLDYGKLLMAKGNKEDGLSNIRQALQYATALGLDFPRADEARQLVEDASASPS